MIDVENPASRDRLFRAIRRSAHSIRPWRENRLSLLKSYVGTRQSLDDLPVERPPVAANLLMQTAEAYMLSLIANRPRVTVETKYKQLAPFAYRYQQTLNNLAEEIRLEDTLAEWILDAFFGLGILKVGFVDSGFIDYGDVRVDPGRPFVQRVSLDDFTWDTRALRWSQCRFMADRYTVPMDVLSDPMFDQSVVARLQPANRSAGRDRIDEEGGDERASDITEGGQEHDDSDVEDMVGLVDVWLARENEVVTFPANLNLPPLIRRPYDGPEGGPYPILSFIDIPDNTIPVGPADGLHFLHTLYNNLLRKASRQAKRQKTNPVYSPSEAASADQLREAEDGEWVKVANPDRVREFKQGGVEQVTVGFMIGVQSLFDRMAGNLSAMAGLGPQSATASQDELIHSAVSRREAKLQAKTLKATAKVYQHLGWMLWVDEVNTIDSFHEAAPGIAVANHWTPEHREGDFWQYNFSIEPHSMAYRSPDQKMQALERVLDRLLPIMQIAEAQGATFDIQEFVEQAAELYDLPRLPRIVAFGMPKADRPGPAGSHSRTLPAKTSREYVRRSVSAGGTQQARNDAMMREMLAAPSNSE